MCSHIQDLSPREAVTIQLPHLDHSITMPDKFDKREVGIYSLVESGTSLMCRVHVYMFRVFDCLSPQKTVSYFATRCQQIIELAIKWTPTETKAILEVCMFYDYSRSR